MASNSERSNNNDDLKDDIIHEMALVRPTILPTTTNTRHNLHYFHIDHLSTSPSPVDTRPRLFQAGILFDANTYRQVLSSVNDQQKMHDKEEEEGEDDDDYDKDNILNEEVFDQKALNNELAQEIQCLSQVVRDDQPVHDIVASIIMQQLNDDDMQSDFEASSIVSETHPYPPANQTGPIAAHDRPYADYGHLDAKTIAKELDFNLTCVHPKDTKSSRGPIRMASKSWAITAWTMVSKETVMAEIKRQFGIERLQYICVAQEIGDQNDTPHLHIQIILKEKANKKSWFLDDITDNHCNYQVTLNDRAWNEYIKKDLNFIEFGCFKSTTVWAQKEWPTPSSSPFSSASQACSTIARPRPTTTSTMARIQTEEKRKHEKEVARQALELAHTSVHTAMDFIRHSMPDKFLAHSSWYLSTFNYVHLRTQHEANRTGNIDKEYVWPISFSDCTPKLREAIERWIRHHFSRAKRAKCLILIGPTGTGKTAFARSLPGHINYFQERWNLDKWSDYARYSVYDDVPWDDFTNLCYPNKKRLLTQNGKLNATDKYRGSVEINVRQPAIVLLNPEDAGSLLAEPRTIDEQRLANYWSKRAFVYIMDSDEYFYKRKKAATNPDDIQISSNSSISTNEDRLGEPDEFDEMIKRYQQKQHHKE